MTTQPLKIVQNSEKQMPCNIEAEHALIGSILISNDIFDEITSGFHDNLGGIHLKLRINPDMAIFSKSFP